MKTVLFYFSKGAKTRARIVKLIESHNKRNKPIFLNSLARKLEMSHVAMKKHIALLEEYGYVKITNPDGKPLFLELTNRGKEVAKEFSSD
ncbi:MAG: helix-turn-helix transcriptional regulator [Candidatus Aenigmarchaeota archaeon]|nr:helix-turn-helix transcriptional regulator [Candidatus Aenigmarchaeota archaeon]